MPSLISKILHKKSPSSSSSPSSPESATSPNKLHKNQPGSERIRHVSLPPARKEGTGMADTRRSLDTPAGPSRSSGSPSGSVGSPVFHRRQGDGPVVVSPTRAAPAPPLPDTSPRSSLERDTSPRATSLDAPRSPPSAYLHNSSGAPYTPGSPTSASSAVVTPVGPQGTHHDRHSSQSSLHLPSYSYHSHPSMSGVRRASHDEPRSMPSPPRSQAGSSPPLPPGAATANPSMHYPQVSTSPRSPKSPLEPTELLASTSGNTSTPLKTFKPVESFVGKPVVAEAPIRKSEEGELGSLHSPDTSSIDSRLLDQNVPPIPPMPPTQAGQSIYQPQMLAVQDHHGNRSGSRSGESRGSRTSTEIPERHSSLSNLQPGAGAMGSVSSFETFGMAGPSSATPRASRDRLDDTSGDTELEQKITGLAIDTSHLQAAPAAARHLGPQTIKGEGLNGDTLERARAQLVDRIVTDAQKRKAARGELSEEAKEVFHRAGLADGLDKAQTVEVKSKWIAPVVKEHIIHQEHTEYTTVIDRDVHRHHVHPKIQPIEDPDPIMLEPRHRIFSAETGKWHEVIGDEQARAILGDDVFTNGPREVRTKRTKAVAGLSPASSTFPRELMNGQSEASQAVLQPNLGYLDGEDPTEAGFGTGGRGAVEREGVVGQKMSDWRSAERGGFFSRRDSEEVGTAW